MGNNISEEVIEEATEEVTTTVELADVTDTMPLEDKKVEVEMSNNEEDKPGPDDIVMNQDEFNNMLGGSGLGGGIGGMLGGLLAAAGSGQGNDEFKKVLEMQTDLIAKHDNDIADIFEKINNLEQSNAVNGTFTKLILKGSLILDGVLLVAVILLAIFK